MSKCEKKSSSQGTIVKIILKILLINGDTYKVRPGNTNPHGLTLSSKLAAMFFLSKKKRLGDFIKYVVGLQIVLRDQKSKEGFKSQSIEIY